MNKNAMKYKGYYGTVLFSPEDECLYGSIAGITDIVSYEGNDTTEIVKGFHEAVDDYIDTCNAVGKKPIKSASGSFNVRIGPDIHIKALIKAQVEHKTLNQVVKEAMEKEVIDVSLPT